MQGTCHKSIFLKKTPRGNPHGYIPGAMIIQVSSVLSKRSAVLKTYALLGGSYPPTANFPKPGMLTPSSNDFYSGFIYSLLDFRRVLLRGASVILGIIYLSSWFDHSSSCKGVIDSEITSKHEITDSLV
ncbi:hypothetical protein ACTXT7_008728 [Hymenolepis weldensis]